MKDQIETEIAKIREYLSSPIPNISKAELINDFTGLKTECLAMIDEVFNFHYPPKVQLVNQIKPDWVHHDFDIPEFNKSNNHMLEIVQAGKLELDGMKFYMQAYPNGNCEDDLGYLSVYVGYDKPENSLLNVKNGKFEYKIAVVNKINPNCLLEDPLQSFDAQEFVEEGYHTWGNNRLASHDELRKNGFISTDGTDTVTVRIYIRRENHCLKNRDLARIQEDEDQKKAATEKKGSFWGLF